MLGAIIGDIVGSRFEFDNYRKKDFELFTKKCFATDDSIMTLAVAKAIMETEKVAELPIEEGIKNYDFILSENVIKYMQQIGRKYPYIAALVACFMNGFLAKILSPTTASVTAQQCALAQ